MNLLWDNVRTLTSKKSLNFNGLFYSSWRIKHLKLCRFPLAARGESTIGRVPSAAGADARRRDAGDAVSSSRSVNAADAPAPPEPFGRMGIEGNLCVARRQRCPRIASSSRLDLALNTHARDLLYFHHGLLGRLASLCVLLISTLLSGHLEVVSKTCAKADAASRRVYFHARSLLTYELICSVTPDYLQAPKTPKYLSFIGAFLSSAMPRWNGRACQGRTAIGRGFWR
jgi:hypothetical protein